MDFNFVKDVTTGNVLTIVTIIGALYLFHTSNVRRFERLNLKVNLMWSHFKIRFNMDDTEDVEDMIDEKTHGKIR